MKYLRGVCDVLFIIYFRINRYWVFRSWGRISTTIGKNKLESFYDLESAKEVFEKQYEEKTGNWFGDREFVKQPGRYYKMDIDYVKKK